MKFIVVGNSAVGKTSLIQVMTHQNIIETTTTIGVDYASLVVDYPQDSPTRQVKCQIWDTAGQEMYRSISLSYFRNAAAVIIVFDVTQAKSFQDVHYWIERVREKCDPNTPFILIGNKCDLEDQRRVRAHTAKELARVHNTRYIELSSKSSTSEEIVESIHYLLNKVYTGIADQTLSTLGPKFKIYSTLKVDTQIKKSKSSKKCCS